MATAEHTHPSAKRPLDDESPAAIWAFVRPQGGQWHATAVDYSIVGSGDTPEEATAELRAMVDEYLRSCAREGVSAEDARRPIPAKWTAALMLDQFRDVARLAAHRRSGHRGQVLLPRHGC